MRSLSRCLISSFTIGFFSFPASGIIFWLCGYGTREWVESVTWISSALPGHFHCCLAFPDVLVSIVCHSLSSEEISGHMTGSLLQFLMIVKLRVLKSDSIKATWWWECVSEGEWFAHLWTSPWAFLTTTLYPCLCCPRLPHPVNT